MSEIKQRKKPGLSPAFMSYGLTLIALGAFELIQAIKDISDGGDIWSIPVSLAAALVPGAFVLKLKEKKTLSTVFAVLSTAYTVFIVIIAFVNGLRFYFYYEWFDIISYIFLHVLLVLFVMLPETPIKSFFAFFPVIVLLVRLLCFSNSFYTTSVISPDTLLLYILGFSMTTTTAPNSSKRVKKNAGVAIEKLESLAKLKEQGILTDEEFETKKAEIMQIL